MHKLLKAHCLKIILYKLTSHIILGIKSAQLIFLENTRHCLKQAVNFFSATLTG